MNTSVRSQLARFTALITSAVLALCAVSAAAEPAYAKRSYTLYVVPQLPSQTLQANWQPLADYLSRETDVKIELRIPENIPAFENILLEGIPDIAYMNPYHAVLARRKQGYQPLVRDSDGLVGILVVRKDSAIRSLRDLEDKTIAFPAPNAFGASLYIRALLAHSDNIPFHSTYAATHTNVYRQVALGFADAGGGVQRTLDQDHADLRARLRVLYRTPGIPSHPIGINPRVPEHLQQAIRAAMLRLSRLPIGTKLLKGIQMPTPTAADYTRDYQSLEDMGLEAFVLVGID